MIRPVPVSAAATADVRRRQPLHPVRQVAVLVRAQHEMEVVGHEAIGQHAHRPTLACGDRGEEGGVVVGLVEDLGTAVAAIQDAVAEVADRGAGDTWQTRLSAPGGSRKKDRATKT